MKLQTSRFHALRRERLVGGVSLTALCLAAGMALPTTAQAACDDNAPTAGTTVTCTTPNDTTGVQGGADNVTVNILSGGIDTTGADGIDLGNMATVDMDAGTVLTTTTSGSGMVLGDNAEVTVGGAVTTVDQAIEVGNDSMVTIESTGSITGNDDDAGGIEGGDNVTIVTEAGSTIMTAGDTISTGSFADAINVGDNADITLGGDIFTEGKAVAVDAGDDLTLLLQEGASINLSNHQQPSIGQRAAITAENGANLTIAGAINTTGSAAGGIRVGGANSSAANPIVIHLTSTGSIHTEGTSSPAIYIERPAAPGAVPPPFVANIMVDSGASIVADQSVAITENTSSNGDGLTNTSLTVAGHVETGVANGVAINLFGGDDRLEVQPGFSIVGDVIANNTTNSNVDPFPDTGTNTFVLGGLGTDSFDAGLLDSDGSDDGEQYFGFTTFVKEDGSTWTLTGTNDETFAWEVTGGTLYVTGDLDNSSFDLSPGAAQPVMFGGTGTIGSFDANEEAVVSPGTTMGEIATLSVTDGFTFETGSTYWVDLDGATSDLVSGSGVGTINGGTVDVNAMPGVYTDGELFTIADVDSLSGPGFDVPVMDDLAFYDFTAVYDSPNGIAQLRVDEAFDSQATTENQEGAAEGLGDLDPSDPDLDDLRTLLSSITDPEDAQELLDNLSGEVYATNLLLSAKVGELFNKTIHKRGRLLGAAAGGPQMAATVESLTAGQTASADAGQPLQTAAADSMQDGKAGIMPWIGVYGQINDIDGDGNAAGVDQTIGGVGAGIEALWSAEEFHGAVGVAGGYSYSDGDVDGRGSDVESDAYHVGLYGSLNAGGFGLSGAVSYAWIDSDVERSLIGLPDAKSDVDSDVVTASLEATYGFPVGEGLTISPVAGLDATWVDQDGYDESGGGGAGLDGDSDSYSTYTTGLGARLSGSFDLASESTGYWEVGALWRHRFGDDVPNADHAFSAAGPGAGSFDVYGPETADDWAEIGLGLGIRSGNVSIGVSYDAALGSDISSHAASVNVGVAF